MTPIDREKPNFDDDPAPTPELDALAECLRREACELSALYPPGGADRVRLDHLPPTRTPRHMLVWRAGAAVAVLVVCAGVWTALRENSRMRASDPKPPYTAQAVTAAMEETERAPTAWPQQHPDVLSILPSNRVGAHDMNGPEIEAVLNLLEDKRTSLKLAL